MLTPAYSVSHIDVNAGTCPIVILRTYTLLDAVNSTTTSFSHIININDTQPPSITGAITSTTVNGCGAGDAPAAETTVAGLEALTGDLLVDDACSLDANITVSSSDASSGTNPVIITRTYNVTDECGNTSANFIHTINIEDTEGPTFTNCPSDITQNIDPGLCSAVVSYQIYPPAQTAIILTPSPIIIFQEQGQLLIWLIMNLVVHCLLDLISPFLKTPIQIFISPLMGF